MIFTQRERRIGYVALGLAGLLVAYFAGQRLWDYRQSLAVARTQAQRQLDQEKLLLNRRPELQQAWANLRNTGLKATPSEAESQLVHAVYDYAPASGLTVSSLQPDRTAGVQNDRFLEISFHATGTGTMAALTKTLWRLETAPFPLRVNAVQITPRKEGTDDLSIKLSISTLCLNPEADKPKGSPAPKERTTP